MSCVRKICTMRGSKPGVTRGTCWLCTRSRVDTTRSTHFVSHVWGDDFEQRYVALRGWAMQFEAEHGRWPVIWLDKACGDANAIVFLPPHGRDSVHLTDWSEIGPSKSVEQPKRIRR